MDGTQRRELIHWSAAALLAVGLVVGAHQGTFVGIERSFDPASGDLAALVEAKNVIQQRWVEAPTDGQLRDGALDGMARSLDPFSAYIPPVETADFERSTTGTFGGLGIWIGVDKGQIVVISPIEGTPAWKAGILPDDRVVSVDGVLCKFETVQQAVNTLKGEIGSKVELQIARVGETGTQTLQVERARIQIRSVKGGRLLDPATKIGYLRVTTFNSGTYPEVKAGVEELLDKGMRGLIVDLRKNPGGLLDQAVRVANLWLPDDEVILSTWSRQQARERGDERSSIGAEADEFPASGYQHTVANAVQIVKIPTVILIDGGSASASEVLAGALQDHGLAHLIGTRSYGKGSVQTIISLQGGKAAIKLTTQYYFTPKGRRIHRGSLPTSNTSWGLLPDQEVVLSEELDLHLQKQERDLELAMLKAKARKVPFDGEERVHLDDPQARRGYRWLLGQLGDPPPADVSPVGSGSVGAVGSPAETAPAPAPPRGE